MLKSMGKHGFWGRWAAPVVAVALVVGVQGTARAADTPVDTGVPAPTVQPGQLCGTVDDPAWRSNTSSVPDDLDVTISVPVPTVSGVKYQGVVRVWDLDDPETQAEGTVDGLDGSWYQSVYVPLPAVDGHAYAWEAQTYDGTSYSRSEAYGFGSIAT